MTNAPLVARRRSPPPREPRRGRGRRRTRRNDPTLDVYDVHDAEQRLEQKAPVRNWQRWQVIGLDPEHQRIAARRVSDGARTVFARGYLREARHARLHG